VCAAVKVTDDKEDTMITDAPKVHVHMIKIGEEGNLAALTHKEWNLLVDLIRSGELKKV
jgi:hypothetical protein